MDIEQIILKVLIILAVFAAIVAAIAIPFNCHHKDMYRKDLILSCKGDPYCIKMILGIKNDYGY